MPKRKGGRYKTILERMQEDPNVCNDWKDDDSYGRKTIYTNKKECLDRIMGSSKDTLIEARDRKRKEKKNKTKSKSRNRTRTRRR